MKKENIIVKGFKAFDKQMKCQDFQYKENTEYKINEKPILCERGFHFCTNPLDILNYYNLCESEFAEVEGLGIVLNNKDEDTKNVTNHIRINNKLSLPEFIEKSIKYFLENKEKIKDSRHASSWDNSQHASSGYNSRHTSSGNYSKHASSGNYSRHASSGDNSQHASSGDNSRHASSGYNSVIAAIGQNSQAKGIIGTWITLAEYDKNNKCIFVKSIKIDGKKLKADVFYILKNKKFVKTT